MTITEKKEFIREILLFAKENGYRAFENTRSDSAYGWIITPQNNIIYIQKGYFWGYDMSLQYVPSRENGSGCSCNEESLTEIRLDILVDMENKGLNFARKLGAQLYSKSQVEKYFSNYWDKENIIEL